MCPIRTRRCNLGSNHRLRSFIASWRRCRVERKYGNTHYLILGRLTGLVLREIGIVNRGSVPKSPSLVAAVEWAYRLRMPLIERTQQLLSKELSWSSLPILYKTAGLVSSQCIRGDKTPSCACLLNDSNTRHVRLGGEGCSESVCQSVLVGCSRNVI